MESLCYSANKGSDDVSTFLSKFYLYPFFTSFAPRKYVIGGVVFTSSLTPTQSTRGMRRVRSAGAISRTGAVLQTLGAMDSLDFWNIDDFLDSLQMRNLNCLPHDLYLRTCTTLTTGSSTKGEVVARTAGTSSYVTAGTDSRVLGRGTQQQDKCCVHPERHIRCSVVLNHKRRCHMHSRVKLHHFQSPQRKHGEMDRFPRLHAVRFSISNSPTEF